MARDYVEADRRIVLGFIEPHFMAGFSGGYKGVFPAIADIDSIMHYHRAQVIGDPRSTWGVLGGEPHPGSDPLERGPRAGRLPGQPDPEPQAADHPLLLRRGDGGPPHGCAFAKATAMVACEKPYPSW
jgi:hypothetical protein